MKILLIVLVVVIVIAGGAYLYLGNHLNYQSQTTTPTPSPTAELTPNEFPISGSATPTPKVTSTPTKTLLPSGSVSPTPSPSATPTTQSVTIQNFAYIQASLTIKKGDTVVWTNKDSTPHTVTGDGGLSSSTLSLNGIYSFKFNNVGTFNYHCALHPSMTGTVIVTQ